MRRLYIILVVLLGLAFPSMAQEQQPLDSANMVKLNGLLEDYYAAVQPQGLEAKISEMDFILEQCRSRRVLDYVATQIYTHYMNSSLMGDEAVAVHVTDKWFIPGKASLPSDLDLMNARIYADFNRSSLLGARAPSLLLEDPEGRKAEILGVCDSSFAAPSDRFRVLYFYSTDCAKCKVENVLLTAVLNEKDYPIDVYAVNTGTDRVQWDAFRAEKFAVEAPATRVFHYWDPSLDSDFQRKYGVLETPRLLLIDMDGKILGRGLDASALSKILDMYYGPLEYGSENSSEFFDAVFGIAADSTAGSYADAARYLASRLSERTADYRQYIGDMLYYLNGKTGEGMHEALVYTADSLILARPDIWRTRDDSLKVVGLASLLSDMAHRSETGTRIADITLKGTLRSFRKSRSGEFNLRKLPGCRDYIMFYSEGCGNCELEKAGIDSYFASYADADRASRRQIRRTRVFMVDVDSLPDDKMEAVLDAFDLSVMPYITLVDKNGIIVRKYLTFTEN